MSIYAVNGKVPVAAWIPSRDTAGNGTTTLTDLVGNGYSGTLVNGPAWVSDTSNGGVRALEFDGSDDTVNMGTIASLNGATKASYSAWVYKASTGNTVGLGGVASNSGGVGGGRFSFIWFSDSNLYLSAENAVAAFGSVALSGTGWRHIVASYDGSLTGNANRFKVWIGGVSQSLGFFATIPSALGSVTPDFALGRDSSNRFCGGRIDDVRLFTATALDGSDSDYLYNSGNGRGRITNNSTFAMGMPV